MKFNEPISIKDYIREKGIDLSKASSQDYMKFVKNFGYKLINAINKNAVATPHGIVASAVLNCSKNSFTKKQLISRANTYMDLLVFMEAELSDTLRIDPDNTLNSVIHDFITRDFIELADEDDKDMTENTVFIVKDNKRAVLDYYKNSAISFFIKYAYTALAILEVDRFQFSSSDLIIRYKFLEKLFLDEFFFDETVTSEEDISACIKGFLNEGILVPDISNSDQFQITSQGLKKLKWFAVFLLPFFESYRTTLQYFEKYEPDKHDEKERIKKIHAMGTKLYKGNLINLKESLSQVTYRNAVHYFIKNGVKGSQDHVQIEFYKNILDRLTRLIES